MKKELILTANPLQMAILLQMQAENILESTRQAVELLKNMQPFPKDEKDEFDGVVGKFYAMQQVLPVLQNMADFVADKQPQEFIKQAIFNFNHAKQMIEDIVQKMPEFRLPESPSGRQYH